ncbi:MAG: glycosyltransferase [Candidatus Omnitrophica bacterium]|nr:glycosyltransferase [Candidatus Omnitrophota bacterium]
MSQTRVFLECTGTWEGDLNTGIQRVVRNIVKEAPGLAEEFNVKTVAVIARFNRFCPVKKKTLAALFKSICLRFLKNVYHKLRPFFRRLLPIVKIEDFFISYCGRFLSIVFSVIFFPLTLILYFRPKIDFHKGDIILLLDSSWTYPIWQAVKKAKNNGATIGLIVHDIFPITQPSFFPLSIIKRFNVWFEQAVQHVDFFINVSKTSQLELQKYIREIYPRYMISGHFGFFTLGCSLDNISSNNDINNQIKGLFQRKDIYITVGTIEPRKNHKYLLDVFDLVWRQQLNVTLCIIGKKGWLSEQIMERIRKHSLFKKNLFMFSNLSDIGLIYFYQHSRALLSASFAEGFGLPIVEALHYGLPVLISDTPIYREVGKDFCAYFDISNPISLAKIIIDIETTGKLPKVKDNNEYRLPTWKDSCRDLFTQVRILSRSQIGLVEKLTNRPKLAYISPLPPKRSGISDYSSELLPELSRHYAIDVIVEQDSVSDPWIRANCPLRRSAWFKRHADNYDRVLYHFGNSPFHQHMFSLLDRVPGVVVLHDFFLSSVVAHMDVTGYHPGFLSEAFYQSHGYSVAQQRFRASEIAEVVRRYPCNLGVLQKALGIVVHSENSRLLANHWYGEGVADNWAVIPLLCVPAFNIDRVGARRKLKFGDNDFVVCSFGLLGPAKLNQQLLDGWFASALAQNVNCVLVFVGQNESGEYGAQLLKTIKENGLHQRIFITGWVSSDIYLRYLAAADVAVQLRTLSRGETSKTVLDCMNYGLATIVNANGSVADLPDDGIWKLPDEFVEDDLVGALETLWREPSRRQQLSARAREIIFTHHAPQSCADQYSQFIERIYQAA